MIENKLNKNKKSNKLKYWDEKFPLDHNGYMVFNSIFLGSRKTGKTYAATELVKRKLYKFYKLIIVVCPLQTKRDIKNDLSDIIDNKKPIIVFADEYPGIIDDWKERNGKQEDPKKIVNILIIYDDMSTFQSKYDPNITSLFTTGRHANMSLMFLTQNPSFVDNSWKNNFDYMFIFRLKSKDARKYLWDHNISDEIDFGYDKKNEEIFYKILEIGTEDFACIILDLSDQNLYKWRA